MLREPPRGSRCGERPSAPDPRDHTAAAAVGTLVMISLVRSRSRCWSRYDASAGVGRVARLEVVWIVPLVVASIKTVDDLPTAVRPSRS